MICMCVVQFGTRYWDAVYDPGSWLWVFRAPQVAVFSLLSFLPCWALGRPPVSVFGCWRVSLISSLIAGRLGLPFSALGCVTCLVCFHHRARGRGAWCLASCWLWPLALGVLGGSAFGSGSAVFQLCRIRLSREEQGANIRAALLGGGHGAWRAAGSSLLVPAGEQSSFSCTRRDACCSVSAFLR